mmetsp:Transcript_56536/g.132598  ORF Transcript_56536/g.132598 Transcript_56536/m.132598 type:complete len:330 (+) Transcript_56536:61-1050(+)
MAIGRRAVQNSSWNGGGSKVTRGPVGAGSVVAPSGPGTHATDDGGSIFKKAAKAKMQGTESPAWAQRLEAQLEDVLSQQATIAEGILKMQAEVRRLAEDQQSFFDRTGPTGGRSSRADYRDSGGPGAQHSSSRRQEDRERGGESDRGGRHGESEARSVPRRERSRGHTRRSASRDPPRLVDRHRDGTPVRREPANDRRDDDRRHEDDSNSRNELRRRDERRGERSRSRSSMRLNARMPHNQDTAVVEDVERAEVIERKSCGQSGENVWQAEISIRQGNVNHSGQKRTFTVRGPPRKQRDQAEDDAQQLTEAASQGARVVRALANDLHRR